MNYRTHTFRLSPFQIAGIVVAIVVAFFFAVRQYNYKISSPVPERESIITDAIELARTNALARERVDWTALKSEALAVANKTGNESDLNDALQLIVARLEDGHSFYLSRSQFEKIGASVTDSSASSITSEVSTVDSVPRIQVNGFMSMDLDASIVAAEKLRAQVEKALKMKRCGVIVDLTENSGGNMYPMLMGLLPLLPEGVLLEFETVDGLRTPVTSEAGAIKFGKQELLPALGRRFTYSPQGVPIAVILGSSTGSAGEMVAIAFKNRENVRFFGEPTAGAVTGNTPFKLKHGGLLALTTSWTLDNKEKKYVEPVAPDETIVGFNANSNALKAAANWVRARCVAVKSE